MHQGYCLNSGEKYYKFAHRWWHCSYRYVYLPFSNIPCHFWPPFQIRLLKVQLTQGNQNIRKKIRFVLTKFSFVCRMFSRRLNQKGNIINSPIKVGPVKPPKTNILLIMAELHHFGFKAALSCLVYTPVFLFLQFGNFLSQGTVNLTLLAF